MFSYSWVIVLVYINHQLRILQRVDFSQTSFCAIERCLYLRSMGTRGPTFLRLFRETAQFLSPFTTRMGKPCLMKCASRCTWPWCLMSVAVPLLVCDYYALRQCTICIHVNLHSFPFPYGDGCTVPRQFFFISSVNIHPCSVFQCSIAVTLCCGIANFHIILIQVECQFSTILSYLCLPLACISLCFLRSLQIKSCTTQEYVQHV